MGTGAVTEVYSLHITIADVEACIESNRIKMRPHYGLQSVRPSVRPVRSLMQGRQTLYAGYLQSLIWCIAATALCKLCGDYRLDSCSNIILLRRS